MSEFIWKAGGTVKLDVVVARDGAHENIFGFRINGDNDIDVGKTAVEHEAGASIDTRDIENETLFGKIRVASLCSFLGGFDFDFADDFKVVIVVFALVVISVDS